MKYTTALKLDHAVLDVKFGVLAAKMLPVSSLATVYGSTWPRKDADQPQQSNRHIRDGPLTVTPILVSEDSAFGAEVNGVDWSQPVPKSIVDQVGTYRILRPVPSPAWSSLLKYFSASSSSGYLRSVGIPGDRIG